MAKHISEARSEAARQNGRKSKGPRTPEGKRVTRLNPVKLGLYTKVALPSFESRADQEAITKDATEFYQTRGTLEDTVAEIVGEAALNFRRMQNARKAFLSTLAELDQQGRLVEPPSRKEFCQRYREALQRQLRLEMTSGEKCQVDERELREEFMADEGDLILQAILLYPDVLEDIDKRIAKAARELDDALSCARELVADRAAVAEAYRNALERAGHDITMSAFFSRRDEWQEVEAPAKEERPSEEPRTGEIDRGPGITV